MDENPENRLIKLSKYKDEVFINVNESLVSPIVFSQLKYWGFVRQDASNWSVGSDIEIKIELIVNYLKKNELSFDLDGDCQKIYFKRLQHRDEVVLRTRNGSQFKEGIYDKTHFKTFEEHLSSLVVRELKQHQLKAAYHAYITGNMANFSVPGSGKTSVVLSIYEKLRSEGAVDFLFVAGPASSFGPWKNEFIKTLGRNSNAKILSGLSKESRLLEYSGRFETDPELYLTTYQTLTNDQQHIEKFLSLKSVRCMVVLDEAHYIKRIDGDWASAALRIAKHGVFRAVLTGTPMPRSYSDLFNLFDFLWADLTPFDQRTRIAIIDHERNNRLVNASQIINDKVGGLFYRVRKKELELLPQNFAPPIYIKMNKFEAEIYRLLFSRIHELSQSDYTNNFETLTKLRRARIIRLRQAASFPPLLRNAIENDTDHLTSFEPLAEILMSYEKVEKPAKVEYLLKEVTRLNQEGQKVLVWSNFISTLEYLKNEIESLGISAKCIYGAVPVENEIDRDVETREQIRNEFVDGKLQVLLANPAACSESISLHTGCQHAIYYDLSYNCAQYLQSLDRIHRVGGSENRIANYQFLLCEDSIDVDILDNVRNKSSRMLQLMDLDYPIYSLDMSEEDNEDINAYNRIFKQ